MAKAKKISHTKARCKAQDDDDRAVLTVPEAGKKLGLSRGSAYAAAKAGQLPTIRIGRLLLVPKKSFYAMLGV